MKILIITFVGMLIAMAGMGIGVIVSNRKLKGSCGGLGNVLGEQCNFCGKKDECEREKKKLCEDDPSNKQIKQA